MDAVDSALGDETGFGDLTTYDLLNGTAINPGVTPIKFTQLKKGAATGEIDFTMFPGLWKF